MSKELEDKPQTGQKYLQKTSDQALLSKIYTELLNLNSEKAKNPTKKWAKDLNKSLVKDIKTANEHMKRCSTSRVVREMQITNNSAVR